MEIEASEMEYEIEKDDEVDDASRKFSYSSSTKEEIDGVFHTEYKEFTEDDYKTLLTNILLYKEGNKEAGQYIVSVFHRFIKVYAEFICNGKILQTSDKKYRRSCDKSLTKFIGLFIRRSKSENAKNALERNRLFCDACNKINVIFSRYEYWDIYNELVCVLLNMANKYKVTKEGDQYHKENGTFHMYVSKCFHFDAFNALKKIVSDPINRNDSLSMSDGTMNPEGNSPHSKEQLNIKATEDYIMMGNFIILKDTESEKNVEHMMSKVDREHALQSSDKLMIKENDIDPYDTNSLNFNWTNGSACGEAFQDLTPYERELLVLSYVMNKTDTEIAGIYGCHRITIVKHKKIAIEKIRKSNT